MNNKIKVDLGCGSEKVSGCIGVDRQPREAVDIVADCLNLPFIENSIDELYARNLLEHFTVPYQLLEEMYRVVSSEGKCIIYVPNYGTYSSECDPTHKFVTDMVHWHLIISSFFKNVTIVPFGTKFQSSSKHWEKAIKDLIKSGLFDLAQGFKFYCSDKKNPVVYKYIPHFMEDFARASGRAFLTPRQIKHISQLNVDISEYK